MMKEYKICGIQQVGIGVKNLAEAWKGYFNLFGVDCKIFEDDSEAKLMLPFTGGKPWYRHAVLALNLQGGGGFEIWQYKGREPIDISEEIRLGDLGILACKIKAKNISAAYDFYQKSNTRLLGEPAEDPSGKKSFFLKDHYGNIFQIVEGEGWFMDEKKETGASHGILIGVSDIEKAGVVYSDILGYDEIVYDSTGIFPDLSKLPGGNQKFRRILLKNSVAFSGPFSKLLGPISNIELLCPCDKPGKKIFEGRFWGDPGFIHLCFDIHGMDDLREYCKSKGHPFTVDSQKSNEGNSFDMGETAAHFSYIEDPDGTLIEFVETHKLVIMKKLGLHLNLKRRIPKPLPDWLVKMLRFSRVKL
jgi:catechol 2,3-dioxygenase-like lactoylglutathione lyase family enzyme